VHVTGIPEKVVAEKATTWALKKKGGDGSLKRKDVWETVKKG